MHFTLFFLHISKFFTTFAPQKNKHRKMPAPKLRTPKVLSIDFEEFRDSYQNGLVPQPKPIEKAVHPLEGLNPNARVLVAVVPLKNAAKIFDRTAKVYWTRPKFPNTINLKQVEYLVPYISGKGIRDLYKVTKIHAGTKQDIDPTCEDDRMRLVFEMKFEKQLFDDYKPHDLKIWHCFTDSTIEDITRTKPLLRFVDLFAGMGGIRLGLEQAAAEAGYDTQCVLTSEIKPAALKVLRQNHPRETICGDITQIETEDIPDFDILCAGFPCQAFSAAGKRLGFEDTRGTLFFEVARILKDKQPKGFILENVEGLVNHDEGKTLETILNTLDQLHYKVSYRLLNSKDFGVPQERKRIYIVGTRGKKVSLDDFPIVNNTIKSIVEKGLPVSNTRFVRQLLSVFNPSQLKGKKIKDKRGGKDNIHSWDMEIKGHISQDQKDLLNKLLTERRKHKWAEDYYHIDWMDGMPLTIDMIREFYEHPNLKTMLNDLVQKGYLVYEHPKKLIKIGGISQRVYDELLPKGYNIVAGKLSFEVSEILDPDGYAPTLVAMDMHRIHVVDGNGIRTLTLKEGKRLFGYPDTYKMDIPIKEGYDLLGNTVVVPVIKKVASRLLETI